MKQMLLNASYISLIFLTVVTSIF